jgi:hypothetical protein
MGDKHMTTQSIQAESFGFCFINRDFHKPGIRSNPKRSSPIPDTGKEHLLISSDEEFCIPVRITWD